MTEAKHTPTPEFIIEEGVFAYSLHDIPCTNGRTTKSNEFWFQLNYDKRHGVKREDAEALVKAMVVAPKLLEACINALKCIDHIGDILNEMDAVEPETEEFTAPLIESIREAIKKATL